MIDSHTHLDRSPGTDAELVAAAREAGAAAFGGLGMLIHQAALSFEIWTGQVPSSSVMSAAALATLAGPPMEPGPAY